jgi:hypothetical protein
MEGIKALGTTLAAIVLTLDRPAAVHSMKFSGRHRLW